MLIRTNLNILITWSLLLSQNVIKYWYCITMPGTKVNIYCLSWHVLSKCRCRGTRHVLHTSLEFLPQSLHLDCFPVGRWCWTLSVRTSSTGLEPRPLAAPVAVPAAWSSIRTSCLLKEGWSCCPHTVTWRRQAATTIKLNRIEFKIATITHKTLQNGQPSYLFDLLHPYNPTRTLRSSNTNLLEVPKIKSEIGRRSFSFSAPTIWNLLPLSLRNTKSSLAFRSQLKTHLFPP